MCFCPMLCDLRTCLRVITCNIIVSVFISFYDAGQLLKLILVLFGAFILVALEVCSLTKKNSMCQ